MAVVIPDASYPYAYDITARQADTYTQQFTFTGQDFTGYTLTFRVLDLYDKRPVLTITPTLTGANLVTVTRTATQMDIRSGRYRYVFEATDGSDVNVEYLKGVFSVLDDVNADAEDTIDEALYLDQENDTVISVEAGEAITSYTPVAIISGLAYKYDSSNSAHRWAYAGFSTNGVSAGDQVIIRQIGTVSLVGWGLTPNTQYLAGVAGAISAAATPVGSVFRKVVGFAVDADTLMIQQNFSPIII